MDFTHAKLLKNTTHKKVIIKFEIANFNLLYG